ASFSNCPLLFYCYAVFPYIHSFPTRRSSDLLKSGLTIVEAPTGSGLCVKVAGGGCSPIHRLCAAHASHRQCHAATPRRGCKQVRSEEHTSELQSRFDLVCRLLLEKKKYKESR